MKTLANAADLDAILARLAALRTDSPRQWGVMSPAQAICHLDDSFRFALGEMPTGPRRDSALTRTVVKWLSLRTPIPWPKGVKTGRGVDPVHGTGTQPLQFDADRERLAARIRAFAAAAPAQPPNHPIFGPLTRDEWLRWGWLHTDHHLRQFSA